MSLLKNKKIILGLLLACLLLSSFFIAQQVSAQIDPSRTGEWQQIFKTIAMDAGYQNPLQYSSTAGVVIIVVGVVRIILGLVGTIFIILIIYAGYLWMTARGNSEQVEKSKQILQEAIIGALIILAAYAITYFIVSGLAESIRRSGG